jgi:hypothetical protein
MVPNAADTQQIWQAARRLSGRAIRSLTATASLNADDGLVLVSAAAGNVVLTLPAANALAGAVAGVARVTAQQLLIVRTDTSANTVTIQRAGSDALGVGTATSYLVGRGERLTIQSDGGATWWLLNSNLTGQRIQVFNASGNFTTPAWVEHVFATAIGGGGGGGGNTTSGAGGGGGGGGLAEDIVPVSGGDVIAVTRGAGGAGGVNNSGTAAGNNGVAGGASSFGSAVVAAGGAAGLGSLSTGQGASGAGGAGTTGALLMTGGSGDSGHWTSNGFGGRGGDAAGGGGGGAGSTGLPTAGGGPGGGGAGGGSNFAGAAGANGQVVVRF